MAIIETPQSPIEWRDSELARTDALALVPDYRYANDLLRYRRELRDWPESTDYPYIKPCPPRTDLSGLMVLKVNTDAPSRLVVPQGGSTTLTITITKEDGSKVIVNDTFAVPVKEIGGNIVRTLGITFIEGVAENLTIQWPKSGEYEINENMLNLHMNNNVWFKFGRIIFSVYEA